MKTFLFGVLGLILVVVLGFLFWHFKAPNNPQVQTISSTTSTVKEVNAAEMPGPLPEDLRPGVNTEAKVFDNFEAVQGNLTQGTRVFQSSKSLSDNYSYYENYLVSKNGWKILNQANQAAISDSILAMNDGGYLTVNISAKGAGSVVDLSYLKK